MGLINLDNESSGGIFAEINVTPLVDVMLVLLIIFMVTAPFMTQTIGVDLPEGQGAKAESSTVPLTISIDKQEAISIAGQVFTLEELTTFLRDSPKVKAGEPIYVEADESIRHKVLVAVMSAAHAAGAHKLSIMVEKP